MLNIAILGSTGSIGINTLEVIRNFPDKFRVIALSANSNRVLLERQIKEFRPLFVCVGQAESAQGFKAGSFAKKVKVFTARAGLEAMVSEKKIDKVVVAISGSAALFPLLKAIECRKQIALANKESLVIAGSIIMEMAAKFNVKIIPIDSEQSAIWQCLKAEDGVNIRNIYLTASGGPFRKTAIGKLKGISVKRVLAHPKWRMGRKISVDSATLMNKGLELLEAMFLFGVSSERIKILVHPEAIIHSMVEFIDGVILAQLSATDMRIPIQYALSYPARLLNHDAAARVDFCRLKGLHFQKPDFVKFPCLKLAYLAASELGTLPAVLNAANEVSVNEFLRGRLKFVSIYTVIERVIGRHRNRRNPDLEEILQADSWARQEVQGLIKRLN
ncbi:MAG: 1-deoxy-D-xylulose-5-phosphate reductoisomerase [Candidatus Omnitrophota bacterium]|nr:1-deoxy-D-xylulose-5-phosphate reductoisomerase [Candidatus Omnitrophota bacterium]